MHRRAYTEAVVELRADDLQTGEQPEEWSRLGYPPLERLFEHPEVLCEVIRTYFVGDILRARLAQPATAAFIINSTDRVAMDENDVVIAGRCFSRAA